MYKKAIITITLAISLAGCATTSDPRQGGLFGGLYVLSTGAYENRIHQRQEELARQQEVNRDLQDKSKVLGSEAQSRDLELVAEQQRVTKIKSDLAQLESEIDGLNAKSDQHNREVAALKLRIKNLRQRLESQQSALTKLDREGGCDAAPERYRILKQERDRLSEEYKNLLEYYQALSDAAS